MLWYVFKRLCYAVPTLMGVYLLTFVLFFMVNTPDDVARAQLGDKRVSAVAIAQWKKQHGYDLPLFYNHDRSGTAAISHTLLVKTGLQLAHFDFGQSMAGRSIRSDIYQRMWPSLALALPTLLLGLLVNTMVASWLTYFRLTTFSVWMDVCCIVSMSVSVLFYIMIGQYVFAKLLRWMPISGFDYPGVWHFLVLPVVIGVFSGVGSGARWYRTLLAEQSTQPYVITARAKGLNDLGVLLKHVLKNAMLPILTGLVVVIPLLFLGSLIMESFFSIPGLGSYTIDAIAHQDFTVVRAMVYLGTVLYLIGLLLTDVAYTLVDPRVRLAARS